MQTFQLKHKYALKIAENSYALKIAEVNSQPVLNLWGLGWEGKMQPDEVSFQTAFEGGQCLCSDIHRKVIPPEQTAVVNEKWQAPGIRR